MSFVQVLALVGGRGLFYILTQLGGRHWSSHGTLRRILTRSEWRTILGLTLFATMADLVFLAAEKFSGKDALPILLVQISVAGTVNWRILCQTQQLTTFRKKLAVQQINDDSPILMTKQKVYERFFWFHIANLTFNLIIIGVLISALVFTVGDWFKADTIMSISQQAILLGSFVFWTTFNWFGLLQ